MLEILKKFQLDSEAVSCEKYGNGHINRTYLVKTAKGTPYILQHINNTIFKNVPALMKNIHDVTAFLRTKTDDPRRVLTLVDTVDGNYFYQSEEGEFYRVYVFVQNSLCLDRAENADDFKNSAIAFGEFQNMLAEFPAHTLYETIDMFHDTKNRFKQLHQAMDVNFENRLNDIAPELEFALNRENDAAVMLDMRDRKELPLRVTHNDTKLNNVLLDDQTRKPLCVIDLDTVMPGLVANDFGDSIRFGASTASEDEPDLSKVTCSEELFKAYTEGFLSTCLFTLTENEIKTLLMGAKLMTLECGIRFLADYLNGDTYFMVHKEKHNLLRARTQFKLVSDMEQKWDTLQNIVLQTAKDMGRTIS